MSVKKLALLLALVTFPADARPPVKDPAAELRISLYEKLNAKRSVLGGIPTADIAQAERLSWKQTIYLCRQSGGAENCDYLERTILPAIDFWESQH